MRRALRRRALAQQPPEGLQRGPQRLVGRAAVRVRRWDFFRQIQHQGTGEALEVSKAVGAREDERCVGARDLERPAEDRRVAEDAAQAVERHELRHGAEAEDGRVREAREVAHDVGQVRERIADHFVEAGHGLRAVGVFWEPCERGAVFGPIDLFLAIFVVFSFSANQLILFSWILAFPENIKIF